MKLSSSNSKTRKKSSENIWVVIPGYNEEKRIYNVIDRVKKTLNSKNIIVVDDGSTDNTAQISAKKGIPVIKLKKNRGKGVALRKGCDYAIKNGAEILVLIDSDGQHKPEELPRLIVPIKERKADIVFGVREFNNKMPFIFRLGNKILNFTQYLLYGLNIKDTQSGFKAFTKNTYHHIKWNSERYSVESEIIARAGKAKLKYKQITIETVYLDKNKGTTIWDGIKIFLDIIKWKFKKLN